MDNSAGQGSNESVDPDDLVREIEKLRAALEGAYEQIGELRSVITRIAPHEPLPGMESMRPSVPPADSDWWKQAGIAQEPSPPEAETPVPSYFGMEGVWVPGKVAEVENLDEILSEMDLEETYAKTNQLPR